MKKLIIVTIITLIVTTVTLAQVQVGNMTEATTILDNDDFYLEADTTGSGDKAARRLEWGNMKDLLTTQLTFNQNGFRVFDASDTTIRALGGDVWIGDKSLNALFVDNSGTIGIGTASPTTQLHLFDTSTETPELLLESEQVGAIGPKISLKLDSSSPVDNDVLGLIESLGDDAGGTETIFNQIILSAEDVTDTDEAGEIEFKPMLNGVNRSLLRLRGYNGSVGEGEIIFNDDSQDVDFRVESDNLSNAINLFAGVDSLAIHAEFNYQGSWFDTTGLATTTDPIWQYDGTKWAIDSDDGAGSIVVADSLRAGVSDSLLINNSDLVSSPIAGEVVVNDGSGTTDFRVETNSLTHAIFVDASSNDVVFGRETLSGTNQFEFYNSGLEFGFTSSNINSEINIFRDDSTPTSADILGEINFQGNDDLGNKHTFIYMSAIAQEINDTDESAILDFIIARNGVFNERMVRFSAHNGTLGEGEIKFNDSQKDIDFTVKTANSALGFVINAATGDVSGEHGSYHTSSDARLKKNVRSIIPRGGLEKVLNLRGVTYEWRDESKPKGRQIGFIAQEVEEQLPEAVHTNSSTGIKSVYYDKIVPVLVEAVEEQQIEVIKLKDELRTLREEINKLKEAR